MWGIRIEGIEPITWLGIIPTYVGNTMELFTVLQILWDHPYVCGEYKSKLLGTYLRLGSSLRMWGIHTKGLDDTYQAGIIPTYVGNTT